MPFKTNKTSNQNIEQRNKRDMEKSSNKKIYLNRVVTILTIACVIFVIIPLGSILLEVFKNGASAISFEFLTEIPGSIGSGKGGIDPAALLS